MVSIFTLIVGIIATCIILWLLELYFSFPIIVDLLVCYLIVFFLMYFSTLINVHKTRNINKLEKFFIKHRKHPFYRFLYAVSNNDEKEMIESYRKMMKQKKFQRLYPLVTIIFSLSFHKTMGLYEEIENLKQSYLKKYYRALVLIEDKQLIEASSIAKTIKRNWAREAIYSEINFREGKKEAAKRHAKKAMKHSRGLRYYLLKKEYERKYSL